MNGDAHGALGRRVRSLISRAIVNLVTANNVRPYVQVKNSLLGTVDKVELHMPYGMSALPLTGGDVILFMNTATSSHAVAIHCDDSSLRITDLQPGEYGWRDQNQSQIVFRQDHLEVTSKNKIVATTVGDLDATVGGQVNLTATGKVVGSASEWDLTGNVKVTGTITSTGTIQSTGGDVIDQVRAMAADRAIYDSHKHGGVQNGSGFTGLPDNLE